MWRRRNLTLEGKIIIFKALALSKFVFLAQFLPIANEITTTNNTANTKGIPMEL